ncbi:hypothetical protein JCM30237_09530 [Halolamina litorea]|uniref:Photosynthesis system II assembly factor Ycf48/Hcf136-like domain-containing protein n=1 Tax=Halolamina litorea TaxID=1515593 RepID=A0ABD6BWS1_9EURY|nr:hypothetical protein [Halolamina litorea]
MGGRYTRRRVLEATGVAGLGGVLGTASTAVAKQSWRRVESPTGSSLTGAEYTSNGAYASGEGGAIIRRTDGDEWVTVVNSGPTGQSKTLNGGAVTDDAERYWVAGNSGVIGEYDTETATLYDHSKPLGIGSAFSSIGVSGDAGDERIYLGKASGEVLIGTRTEDGGIDWMLSDTGSGYDVQAVDFQLGSGEGYVSTSGGSVYWTADAGGSWSRVGVDASQTGYTAVLTEDRTTPNHVYVGGGGGRILRLDCDCNIWTPTEAGSKRIHSLESNNKGERFLGAGGSGRIYHKADASDGAGWKVTNTSTGNALLAAAPADKGSEVDIVVGNSGTIIER